MITPTQVPTCTIISDSRMCITKARATMRYAIVISLIHVRQRDDDMRPTFGGWERDRANCGS